jgi:uncharacterized protein YpmS
MSYLDNEFNTDLEDDVENLDEPAPMEIQEIIEKTNDENYKIISDMFDNLNDYINNYINDYINDKPYTFPIMQYLDRNNFDNWFSQFIIAGNINIQKQFSGNSNKRRKNKEF